MKNASLFSQVLPINRYEDIYHFYQSHKGQIRDVTSAPSQLFVGENPSAQMAMACSAVLSCAYFLDRSVQLNNLKRNDINKPYVIHLVGVEDDTELNYGGSLFFFLPLLLSHLSHDGKSRANIEVHCYNPVLKRSGQLRVPGIKLMRWAKPYSAEIVQESLGKVDLVLLMNPGFESQPESWLDAAQGGPVPYLCHHKVPTIVTSYGIIDSDTDRFVLECHAFDTDVHGGNNMFSMDDMDGDSDETKEIEAQVNPFAGPIFPSLGQQRNDELAGEVGSYAGAWFDLIEFEYDLDESDEATLQMWVDEEALDIHKSLCDLMFSRFSYYGDKSWFEFGVEMVSGDGHIGFVIDTEERLVYFPQLRVLGKHDGKKLNRIEDEELLAEVGITYAELKETLGAYSHLRVANALIGMGLFVVISNSGKVKMTSPKNALGLTDFEDNIEFFSTF